MHYLVRILTETDNKEQAIANAFSYADDLVESGDFDWYNTGSERWNEGGKAFKLSSKTGQKWLQSALDNNRHEFNRGLEAVKAMLNEFSDDDIYNEKFGTPEQRQARKYFASRYSFTMVGRGQSYLYGDNDLWGGAIQNDSELEQVTKDRKDLWIVSIDFHN